MILSGEEFKTEEEFLLKLISKTIWNVLYHEKQLKNAHRHLAIVRAALARGYADVIDGVTDEEDAPEDADSPVAYARALLGTALSGISHHENELRGGHEELAIMKAVLARMKVRFDLARITAEETARLDRTAGEK